jgi:hypothetical protein
MTAKEWLESEREYNTGVEIYAASDRPNQVLVQRFRKQQTNWTVEKLAYELEKVAGNQDPIDVPITPPTAGEEIPNAPTYNINPEKKKVIAKK